MVLVLGMPASVLVSTGFRCTVVCWARFDGYSGGGPDDGIGSWRNVPGTCDEEKTGGYVCWTVVGGNEGGGRSRDRLGGQEELGGCSGCLTGTSFSGTNGRASHGDWSTGASDLLETFGWFREGISKDGCGFGGATRVGGMTICLLSKGWSSSSKTPGRFLVPIEPSELTRFVGAATSCATRGSRCVRSDLVLIRGPSASDGRAGCLALRYDSSTTLIGTRLDSSIVT